MLDRGDETRNESSLSIWHVCMAITASVYRFIGFVEAVDPDLDAMTPGNSQLALNNEERVDFANSYGHIPFIGCVVAHLGLPGILGCGMLVVTAWQVGSFCRKYGQVQELLEEFCKSECTKTSFPDEKKKTFALLLGNLSDLADIANLLHLSSFLREKQDDWSRASLYMVRAPELMLQTWFSVSVVIFTSEATLMVAGPILASVATSYIVSVKEICGISINIKSKVSEKGLSSLRPIWFLRMAVVILHGVCFVAITARIIAIYTCSSHDLQITRWRCAPSTINNEDH